MTPREALNIVIDRARVKLTDNEYFEAVKLLRELVKEPCPLADRCVDLPIQCDQEKRFKCIRRLGVMR